MNYITKRGHGAYSIVLYEHHWNFGYLIKMAVKNSPQDNTSQVVIMNLKNQLWNCHLNVNIFLVEDPST